MDKQRIVMPPSLAVMNSVVLYYLIQGIFWWEEGIYMAVLSGLGLGYIYYELLHYWLHVGNSYVLSLCLPQSIMLTVLQTTSTVFILFEEETSLTSLEKL